ncbi:EAL domain-containing protein [Aeromicrobium sp. S22]|nr:EAL domain-containing protein [Aeromicrobium sp. S22]
MRTLRIAWALEGRDGRHAASPEAVSAPLRVLVVANRSTDADLVQVVLGERLAPADLELEVELGLPAALSRLSAERFDVIVVDGLQTVPDVELTGALRTAQPETSLMIASGAPAGHVDLWARLDPAEDKVEEHAALADLLGRAIADAERDGLGVAVAHLDLSSHARGDDQLQHPPGDGVLREVTDRLLAHLRPGDTVGRTSDGELMVLWRDLDGAGPAEVAELGEGLVRTLERPFGPPALPVQVSASVGVVRHAPGWGPERTLCSAALALTEARARGAGTVVVFTPELREAAQHRTMMETELRAGVTEASDQIVLHYQPVVDLTTGQVVAVEALARWHHPVLGEVPPSQFIALAERMGLIRQLGDWVLDQAIQDAGALTHEGRELDIAVNFSVLQLDQRTVTTVQEALARAGIRPGRLMIEVTESALVQDEDVVVRTLEALADLGVRVAIDDFGTGYSSLHSLRRYPIDTIKIDREFVAGIGRLVDDEAICTSVVHLASSVNATTIVEGVETVEQYAFLRAIGCHQGQGYLWSAPVPLERLPEAIASCERVPPPSVGPRRARIAEASEARTRRRW